MDYRYERIIMEKKEQIINLISGNIDSTQKGKLLNEIKNDPLFRKEYETIKNAWALASFEKEMEPYTIEKSYLSFKKKKENRNKSRILFISALKYAAIAILIFSLGTLTNQFIFNSTIETPLTLAEYNQITVPYGEKAELVLSDGSKVWLNAGTTLEFPSKFDKLSRKVNIIGEAFFEVKKGNVPFVVSSVYGDIKVLGTSFNVRAYNNLKFQTTLEEGKIQFINSFGEKILVPGQQLTYSENEGFDIKKVNPEFASSWKNGVISFQHEPLGEVMKKLERHFNIKIVLDQHIAPIRFTGQIFNESVDEVMVYINKTKPIKYNYDKISGTLTIKNIK